MSLAVLPTTRASAPAAPASLGLAPVLARRGEFTLALSLRHAGRRVVTLRYELLGEDGLPLVFVAGGISANRHVASSERFPEEGWWESQVARGRRPPAPGRSVRRIPRACGS